MCTCTPENQLYPGLHQRSIVSRLREVILPLCSAVLQLVICSWLHLSPPSRQLAECTLGTGCQETTMTFTNVVSFFSVIATSFCVTCFLSCICHLYVLNLSVTIPPLGLGFLYVPGRVVWGKQKERQMVQDIYVVLLW